MLGVFVLYDFENRLEHSSNHVPRWETDGVFLINVTYLALENPMTIRKMLKP